MTEILAESMDRYLQPYEELRERAVGQELGCLTRLGAAILRNRGMAAWLKFAANLLGSSQVFPREARLNPAPIPEIHQAEIVQVLVAMVLAAGQEGIR